jgi:hypothetical protein
VLFLTDYPTQLIFYTAGMAQLTKGLSQTSSSTHQFACEFTNISLYFSLQSVHTANGHSASCEERLFLYTQSDTIADLCFNNEILFCPFTSYHHSLSYFQQQEASQPYSLTPTVKHLFTKLFFRNGRAYFGQVSLSLNNDETSYCRHR